ncbi:MAG: hypothetical protein NUV65_00295 [Candidatus Roizmanbacteria bacterium]|nr:hypothetical protein [Candidatus Roizmanbacteria bacterium]
MSAEDGSSPETNKRATWVPITNKPDSRFAVWNFEDFGYWSDFEVSMAQHDALCTIYGTPPVKYSFGKSPQPSDVYTITSLPSPYQEYNLDHSFTGAYALTIDPSQLWKAVSAKTRPGEKVSRVAVAGALERCIRHGLGDITFAHTMSKYGWGQNEGFPPMRDFLNVRNVARIIEEGGPLLLFSLLPELIAHSDSLTADVRTILVPIIYAVSKVGMRIMNDGVDILSRRNPQYMAQLFRESMLSNQELGAHTKGQLFASGTTAIIPGGILFETLMRNIAGNIAYYKPFLRYDEEKVKRQGA